VFNKPVIALIASTVSLAVISGILFLPGGPFDRSNILDIDNPNNLGLTYVPLSPESCGCYGLEIDSGALITEVIPGSPIDMASVKSGDVIISYNGTELNKDVNLLTLVKEHSDDEDIVLEICRGDRCYSVNCCTGCGSGDCDCDHQKGTVDN
jgi:hypothetical protein